MRSRGARAEHGLPGGGAAAYLGLGATWAMGLSSSAAQLQANPASLPKTLLPITGVIPFSETIFLWQSIVITAVLLVVSVVIAIWSAPGRHRGDRAGPGHRRRHPDEIGGAAAEQPGEWLEHSPLLTIAAGRARCRLARRSSPARAP